MKKFLRNIWFHIEDPIVATWHKLRGDIDEW